MSTHIITSLARHSVTVEYHLLRNWHKEKREKLISYSVRFYSGLSKTERSLEQKCLQMAPESDDVIETRLSGSAFFQILAAATGNARLPTVESLKGGTTRRLVPEERRLGGKKEISKHQEQNVMADSTSIADRPNVSWCVAGFRHKERSQVK